MLTIQTYIPEKLRDIVKSFWCLEINGQNGSTYTEDILPDGHHEIIFQVSGNARRRFGKNNIWVTEPKAFFAGQTLESYSLELQNNSLLYGIRFYPHTMSTLFGFPAHETTNGILSIHEISSASMLSQCLAESTDKTFTNFETVLMRLYGNADFSLRSFQYIQHAVNTTLTNNGNVKIKHLTNQLGVSQRYFDTTFKELVGINPKQFCNIVKLNYLINYKNNNPTKSITECCYESNFFDQSHLIKLFRQITGNSPKDYFRSSNRIDKYFLEM